MSPSRSDSGGAFFVGHDLGTGGDKAVLVTGGGNVVAAAGAEYALTHPAPGRAEQDPGDWWNAVAASTRSLVADSGVDASDIAGICFAGQMLALVAIDAGGVATRPAISWLDNRAVAEAAAMTRRLGGDRVLRATVGASPSGKDIAPKVAWIRNHEPDVFARTDWFCDATAYLVARATGNVAIDQTGAAATGIVSRRTRGWSRLLAALARFPLAKMPPVRRSIDIAGELTPAAADDCGLAPGTPVAMGLADIPAAAVGSGALDDGDAHIYLGTSSWLGVSLDRPQNFGRNGIVSVASADPEMFLMIAESETAGACIDWFLSEVVANTPAEVDSGAGDEIYAELNALAGESPPGAKGLVFAPWMFGERSPVADVDVRGALCNLSLEHGRADMIRAAYEGVAANLRWILDVAAGGGIACPTLRAIGGGAQSDVWLQIIADMTGRRVERVARPQQAGAVGAALISAVALGAIADVGAIKSKVEIGPAFEPRVENRATYDTLYRALRRLYPALSELGRSIGGDTES